MYYTHSKTIMLNKTCLTYKERDEHNPLPSLSNISFKWLYILTHRYNKKRSDETPLPTPTYKYNSWASDKRKIQYTPRDTDENGIGINIGLRLYYQLIHCNIHLYNIYIYFFLTNFSKLFIVGTVMVVIVW